ncbi:MAG: hypothetical protein F4Y31_08620 [Gammaproteobacteria bacterium]|nr:hypothetical protein [Gammaproteobacteria bacterium]MYF68092.1 hypothetical protein [Gammaproteobacteria bacterium]MYK37625.1 hypothetical protein [Gammaproteobacteria bacterium]
MINRIARDFLTRRSRFLLLGSALYMAVSLLSYSLNGPDGFGSTLALSGMAYAGVLVGVILAEYQRGLTRAMMHLPIDRRALAKAYCAVIVGVPTAWALGLALIAWLFAYWAGGVGWIAVPMAVASAFLIAGLCFCMDALENSGRKYGGESAPRRAMIATWALFITAWLAGEYAFFGSFLGTFRFLGSPDAWQAEHPLVFLALGAALSGVGYARTRALLTARRSRSRSGSAAPGRAIRKRLPLARNLAGFAAITAGCLWMPIAIVAALGAFFAIDIWIRDLLELSGPYSHMDLADPVVRGSIFACLVVVGFSVTVPRFANFRVLKGLPLSTSRLGACVTLLPAVLVLIQLALAFPLLHALDPVAAADLSLPLAGAVGIGALLCPAFLVRPQQDIAHIAALVVIAVLVSVWFTASVMYPRLQEFAPLLLAGGLFASWALSSLVFRYALAAADKPEPLQRVSPGGNA